MKKVSSYLVLIVAGGILIMGLWAYFKYFKGEDKAMLSYSAERGSLNEYVKVRGQVVPDKEFNLSFLTSGVVNRIYSGEGQIVKRGAPLMELDTTELRLSRDRLESVLEQRKTNLEKLAAGYTKEDIDIAETKVQNALGTENLAQTRLLNSIKDSYTVSDNALRGDIDSLFLNPASDPKLAFATADAQAKNDLEMARLQAESMLVEWKSSINKAASENASGLFVGAQTNLTTIRMLLEKMTFALNKAVPSGAFSQPTIDSWRAAVASERTAINTSIAALNSSQENLKNAQMSLSLAQNELALKKAGTRPEDIKLAQAQISEAEADIAAAEDKIGKSILYAPADGKIVKIALEKGEIFTPGTHALVFASSGSKLQADVSELEIGKFKEFDKDVEISFDAFPSRKLSGKLVGIESQEVIKDGDKYYRINVIFDKGDLAVRTGMSADLKVLVAFKENVVKIPDFAVFNSGGEKFVKVRNGKNLEDRSVQIGISDGEMMEIISGIAEGETVIVSEN